MKINAIGSSSLEIFWFTMRFNSLFILASFAGTSFAQTTVAEIQDHINNKTAPALSDFVTKIDAFPTSHGTLAQAMAIRSSLTRLKNAMATTTNAINGATCPVSDTEGQAILASFQALLPNMTKASADIIARRDAIMALPLVGVSGLVQHHFLGLNASSVSLASAFISCVPPNVVPGAEQLQTNMTVVFTNAMAAFN
ncbi:hypothetical protein C0995_002256 [Termitomyces sp. Mi166|nr:hypothetical protein C0995_002256 [Termitomyces sp. Mi166\